MNYFIGESATGLAEMLPRWREDDVRVVIITGAIPGKYITHYSVEELVELAGDRASLVRASYDLIYGWHGLLQSLSYLDKPVIAAMTGDTGGANLPMQEGLRVEAEEWLKTIVTDEAMDAMRSPAETPFEERRQWVRDHGAWPEPGAATGLLLIALPLAFNAAFALLAARFDCPDVLRQPSTEVLARFHRRLVGAGRVRDRQSGAVADWLGVAGIAIGAALMVCSLEFVGGFEPRGWRLAAALTPPVYVAWSLWLIAVGIALV